MDESTRTTGVLAWAVRGRDVVEGMVLMSAMPGKLLAGRCALITGGARGLGLAIARALGEAGAELCLVDRLADVEQTADLLAEEVGQRATSVTADVTSPASVQAAYEAAEQALGPVTVVVNAAGISLGVDTIDMDVEDWRRVLEVNVTGTMLVCQELARRRAVDGRSATVVNVSSMSGHIVNVPQHQTAYNVSKAAVAMLTKSLAIEWLPLGIRVNAIAPGYFSSDMTRNFAAGNPAMAREWVSRIPLGRMGHPHELGPVAVFLASEQSSYVVGQDFIIDGGYTTV